MKRSIMLKGPRACLLLLLFLIAFLACECWQAGGLDPEANVFLIFESAAEVRTVLLAQADRVKLAQNAGHAPLRAGDAFHFCVPEAEEAPEIVLDELILSDNNRLVILDYGGGTDASSVEEAMYGFLEPLLKQ